MELGLTQEIDRLNNEVDTLRSQVTFWEEKSDHRKERIKELKEENEKFKRFIDKLREADKEKLGSIEEQQINLLKEIDHKNKKFEEWGVENKELKKENKKLQKEKFDYNVFAEEKTNMCVLLSQTIRENEELKEYNEEWFRIYGVEGLLNDLFYDGYTTTKLIGGWNSGKEIVDEVIKSITELKEKIDELKNQIPDKKGKKLSQKDKEALEEILHNIENHGTAEYHNDGGGWFYEAKVNLLKRLLK